MTAEIAAVCVRTTRSAETSTTALHEAVGTTKAARAIATFATLAELLRFRTRFQRLIPLVVLGNAIILYVHR